MKLVARWVTHPGDPRRLPSADATSTFRRDAVCHALGDEGSSTIAPRGDRSPRGGRTPARGLFVRQPDSRHHGGPLERGGRTYRHPVQRVRRHHDRYRPLCGSRARRLGAHRPRRLRADRRVQSDRCPGGPVRKQLELDAAGSYGSFRADRVHREYPRLNQTCCRTLTSSEGVAVPNRAVLPVPGGSVVVRDSGTGPDRRCRR